MSGDQETDCGAQARPEDSGPIGARLVAAREKLQLTPESVARQLRLDVSVINALEQDDAGNLPAPIFVQGYLRSYARLLNLPVDELVNDYNSHRDEPPPLTVNRVSPGKPVLRLPSMRLMRRLMMVVLVVILLWLAYPFLSKMLGGDSQPGDEQSPGHLAIPPAEE
jgi:cytoskeleton protein RodZ